MNSASRVPPFYSLITTFVVTLVLISCASRVVAWGPSSESSAFIRYNQIVRASADNVFRKKVIHSGHSLTDPIPPILKNMVRASGMIGIVMDRSTIPGSPLEWRWKNAPNYGLPDARGDIANYDTLVLTERVSLALALKYHASDEWALHWFNHAWKKGNNSKGSETFLYATWVPLDSGPNFENPYKDPEGHIRFRERLPLEFARWEHIMEYVNDNRPPSAPPMRMIPGTLIMAAAYDAIEAGRAPGLNEISDLFKDDIHPNDKGAYLIALAHFAVIYGKDPRGLPNRLGLENPPSAELADWMQELVWSVVNEYEGTGLAAMK